MKKLTIFALLALASMLWTVPVEAQTTTTQTVISSAMTATQTFITVASSTGFSASTSTATFNVFVDGELMRVLSQVGSTNTWNVTRGISTRGVAHPTGSYVFFGPAVSTGPFVNRGQYPGTSCTPNNFQFLPIIDVTTSTLWNCVSTTVSGGAGALGGGDGGHWNAVVLDKTTNTHPVTVIGDANYTALLADEFIVFNKTSAGRTITLPAITGIEGKTYVISQPLNATQTITIQGSAAQLFGSNGTTSITMTVTPTRLISVLFGSTWAWVTW